MSYESKKQKAEELAEHNEAYEKKEKVEQTFNGSQQDPSFRAANNDVMVECISDHMETNGLGDTMRMLNELMARTIVPFMLAQGQNEVKHQVSNGVQITFNIAPEVVADFQIQSAKKKGMKVQ